MTYFPDFGGAEPEAEERALGLARIQLARGQAANALATLARVVPSDANAAEVYTLRAHCENDLDRHEDAERSARRALRADAEHDEALLALTQALQARDRLAEAEAAILECLRRAPEDSLRLSVYAAVCLRAGQFDKAESLLTWARRRNPECEHAYFVEWKLCLARGDKKRGAALARACLARHPDTAHAHSIAGATYLLSEDLRKARRHYAASVALDPSGHDRAKVARALAAETSWLMVPLIPFRKLGTAGMWFVGVGGMVALNAIGRGHAAYVWSVTYTSLCVYTWVVPPLVRWWRNRRFL